MIYGMWINEMKWKWNKVTETARNCSRILENAFFKILEPHDAHVKQILDLNIYIYIYKIFPHLPYILRVIICKIIMHILLLCCVVSSPSTRHLTSVASCYTKAPVQFIVRPWMSKLVETQSFWHILVDPDSNFSWDTNYPYAGFSYCSSVPPAKYWDNTLNYVISVQVLWFLW